MARWQGIVMIIAVGLLLYTASLAPALTAPLTAENQSDPTTLVPDEAGLAAAINHARVQDGLLPLAIDPVLTEVARERSSDQIVRHYFAHVTPDGSTVYDLLDADGVDWTVAGENLARVRDTDPVEASIDGFLASPEHRANVLGVAYDRVGVGEAEASDGTAVLTVVFVN
jgi:uncharacterized protein YkwD